MVRFSSRQMTTTFLLALLVTAIPSSLHAQSQTTGAISGSVKDQTGALLPGVEVKAEQEGTGQARSSVTNEVGAYTVPQLAPGRYSVTFSLPGFQTVVNRNVTVNATERITLNGSLQVANVGTTVA